MNLFEVYTLLNIEVVRGKGAFIYDNQRQEYLDFYGGHAVISIGHSHPYYVDRISNQLNQIGFYSNSVINALQQQLADRLGALSKVEHYDLFLCNSGAEANENALKMASFYRPNTNKVVTIKNAFHGRTSAAVNVTDNLKIKAPINQSIKVETWNMADLDSMVDSIEKNDTTAVILEAIQGIGGLNVIPIASLEAIDAACKKTDTPLIMDEVQCGYGRTGKFFAYQHANITPDIITIAKGMGNGFPIGGVLLNNQKFQASPGLLGTTFGGNHLACAAGLAVLEVMEQENVMENIQEKSDKIIDTLKPLPGVSEIKGKGLMLGAKFEFPIKELRTKLATEQKLMTGNAKDPNLLRLLPPLNITNEEIDLFEEKISNGLKEFHKKAK